MDQNEARKVGALMYGCATGMGTVTYLGALLIFCKYYPDHIEAAEAVYDTSGMKEFWGRPFSEMLDEYSVVQWVCDDIEELFVAAGLGPMEEPL